MQYKTKEVEHAIEEIRNDWLDQRKVEPFTRKFDFIVRKICMGCGRTLGKYECANQLAWCYSCRKVLFPETIMN